MKQPESPLPHSANSFRWKRSLALALGSVLNFLHPALAQVRTPPTRTHFVFHVYVNPIHGDNVKATAANPNTTSLGQRPLDYHPEPASPAWPIGGVLQHAPYHFKTLTGTNGAIAWIESVLMAGNLPLPWPHPGSPARSVDWILVHCLPGLYGPIGDGLPDLDPVSGQRYNG